MIAQYLVIIARSFKSIAVEDCYGLLPSKSCAFNAGNKEKENKYWSTWMHNQDKIYESLVDKFYFNQYYLYSLYTMQLFLQ